MRLFLKATTKTKAVWRASKSFRCSCSCHPRSSLKEYILPDPRFSIALFLEVALALFIHILISSGISLAPRRAWSSWIELYSCFPLQVVMKGDRAAIHRTRRAGKRKREAGGEKRHKRAKKRLGKVSEADSTCSSFQKENQSLKPPHHLFFPVFFKGRYI